MSKNDFIEAEDYYEIGAQWLEEKEYLKAIESFRHVISLNNNFTLFPDYWETSSIKK